MQLNVRNPNSLIKKYWKTRKDIFSKARHARRPTSLLKDAQYTLVIREMQTQPDICHDHLMLKDGLNNPERWEDVRKGSPHALLV